MIELISAAKVGKISETDVSLPEKVVSNQEKCQVPWQIGTCPLTAFMRRRVKKRAETVKNIWRFRFLLLPLPAEKILMVKVYG